MRIGFIGVGKLGRDVAEVMSQKHDVIGYDVKNIQTSINMTSSLENAVKDKDFVFVAVPTPHDKDYDGKFPTSHLEPKNFNYETLTTITKKIASFVVQNFNCFITVLPGTIRKIIKPILQGKRFIYNPYLIAQELLNGILQPKWKITIKC